jgi:hypothetical protein
MAGKELYTAEQMINALIKANGMKTIAARNLGCEYNTVVRYINKYSTVAKALELSQQNTGDNIESTLLEMALGRRGEDGETWKHEPNISALIFLAKVHPTMRERGYVERQEVTGKDGAPIESTHTIKFEQLDDDELDNLITE